MSPDLHENYHARDRGSTSLIQVLSNRGGSGHNSNSKIGGTLRALDMSRATFLVHM